MTSTKNSLEVSHLITAPREQVYEAWTRREQMDWYSPEDMEVIASNADVRVGGMFRASMKGPDAKVHTAYGKYLVLAPSRKLVFTHQWEGPNPVETRVTVELADRPGGTEVTLRQEGFLDPEEAKGHEKGWASALRNLAKKFSKPASKSAPSKSMHQEAG
jgi:uncharacterized protein YndB with AHSA1/START domain